MAFQGLRGYDLSNEFGERKEVGKVKKKLRRGGEIVWDWP
jgi:hypothetical protein